MDRRDFLARAAGAGLVLGAGIPRALAQSAPADLQFGPANPFSYEVLQTRAKALAAAPYQAPEPPAPALINSLDFDAIQKIRFRPQFALWPDGPFPVQLFHLHRYVTLPVKLHIVRDHVARELVYSPRYFNYGDTGLAQKLPPDLGFAGFRVMDGPKAKVPTGSPSRRELFPLLRRREPIWRLGARHRRRHRRCRRAEEFPRFTEFWLAEARAGGITIYALLDGPSLAGAYRIRLPAAQRRRGGHGRRTPICSFAPISPAWRSRRSPACTGTARTSDASGRRLASGNSRQ